MINNISHTLKPHYNKYPFLIDKQYILTWKLQNKNNQTKLNARISNTIVKFNPIVKRNCLLLHGQVFKILAWVLPHLSWGRWKQGSTLGKECWELCCPYGKASRIPHFLSLQVNKNTIFMENKNSVCLVYHGIGLLTENDKTKLSTEGWLEVLISFPSIIYKIIINYTESWILYTLFFWPFDLSRYQKAFLQLEVEGFPSGCLSLQVV